MKTIQLSSTALAFPEIAFSSPLSRLLLKSSVTQLTRPFTISHSVARIFCSFSPASLLRRNHALRISSHRPPWRQIRTFAAIAPADLKHGVFFVYNGHYCEAKESRLVKQGRGAVSTAVEYYDLNDRKTVAQKFSPGQKVERIEVERSTVQLLSVEGHVKRLIAVDENFDEVIIPFEALTDGEREAKELEPGTTLTLIAYKGHIIKVQVRDLPSKKKKTKV